MSFTPAQCRAARALLDWSQGELADASGVATKTIADFERGQRTPYDRTLADIQKALEAAGIEFTNGGQPGVRMKKMEDGLWQRIVLRDEQKVAGMTALLKAIQEAIKRNGRPTGEDIWCLNRENDETVYFFPPKLASLILDELKAWKAIPAPLPNLKPGFKKVPF